MQGAKRTLAALAATAYLLAGMTGPARAQGFFYVEQEKGGRLHVFNLMQEYDHWKKTGEMGKSITRPGAGPNGETVVFDSEEAIHLYNFKHDRPGEVIVKAEEKKPTQKFAWKDGKTTFTSDLASLSLSNRIQVRYTVEDPESGSNRGSFRIRRAKTKFEGWAFSKDLTYELQMNWPDTANPLEDVVLQYDLSRGKKLFQLKAGQFKVPFGRQELTSSGSQQFVDRSIVASEFERGRDTGVQIGGTPAGGRIDWRLGIFNGNGRTRSANDNDKYQIDGRLTLQPWGDLKYSESDFESKERPLFAVAGNFEINDLRGTTDGNDVKRKVLGVDAAFKYRGFSAMGEVFRKVNTPEQGDDYRTTGWHGQAGLFLYGRSFEVAGRYARFDPDHARDDDDRKEYGIAANWFWNKHALKLQADLRWLENLARASKDREFRLQSQFIF